MERGGGGGGGGGWGVTDLGWLGKKKKVTGPYVEGKKLEMKCQGAHWGRKLCSVQER